MAPASLERWHLPVYGVDRRDVSQPSDQRNRLERQRDQLCAGLVRYLCVRSEHVLLAMAFTPIFHFSVAYHRCSRSRVTCSLIVHPAKTLQHRYHQKC